METQELYLFGIQLSKRFQRSWRVGRGFTSHVSFGGRITLIKALNIPFYYMFLFKMPCKVVTTVEKYQRDFLWEGGRQKKDYLVKWDVVVKVKEKGGLGLGRLKERNLALLIKWLWRFSMEQGSLWHSIILSRYECDANGWNCN